MGTQICKIRSYGPKIKKISHLLALGVKDAKSPFGVNRAGEKYTEDRNDARNDGKSLIPNNHGGVSTNSMLQFGFDLLPFQGGCQERRVTVGLIDSFNALVCLGTFSFWRVISRICGISDVTYTSMSERSWILRMRLAATCLLATRHTYVIGSHQSIERVGIPPMSFFVHAELYCSL